MASTQSGQMARMEIFPYFEGVNSLVSSNISKKVELSHCENARSLTIGTIEKRQGTRRLGDSITATANYGLFYFVNSGSGNSYVYRISTVSSTTSIYYLNSSAAWTALSGGGTSLTGATASITIAENCCFIVDGTNANRYISGTDGTTVTTSAAAGHLYLSPTAYIINYYNDRLYIADYTVGSTRYKNSVMMSSPPLGILGLVDGDHLAADCGADDWITVTDTKYIYTTDAVDIYRGGTKIADITIKDKDETRFQINAITFAGSYTSLNSADEVWADGTYSGTRIFRWAMNPATGIDVKQYDTFKISGGQNESITMMANIADVMLVATKDNMAVWNAYNLKHFDLGIGNVSKRGYVKALGTMWFLHYTGIYVTTGERPKLMSAKVEKYIEGATKAGLEAAAAGRKGMSVFFAIGAVTLYNPDGSVMRSLSDVCLEYNMRTENWYVHTGIKATQFMTYISTSYTDRLEYSSTETGYHVFEFLTDNVDDKVTSDKEIIMRVDTSNVTLSKRFENICYPMEIAVEVERGTGIQCFVAMDNGHFYELKGTCRRGLTILKITNRDETRNEPPRCRQIKLSFRDATKSLCKISRVAIMYRESEERELIFPEKK